MAPTTHSDPLWLVASQNSNKGVCSQLQRGRACGAPRFHTFDKLFVTLTAWAGKHARPPILHDHGVGLQAQQCVATTAAVSWSVLVVEIASSAMRPQNCLQRTHATAICTKTSPDPHCSPARFDDIWWFASQTTHRKDQEGLERRRPSSVALCSWQCIQ